MKKVGIITLIGDKNYGNKFQNFAVQEILKSLGFNVETIVIKEKYNYKEDNKNFLKKLNGLSFGKVMEKFVQYKYKKSIQARTEIFRSFTLKYIISKEYDETFINSQFHNNFDYFVVGSDQVWNPHYINSNPNFFLAFAPKTKRIAFSPSFGIDSLPDEYYHDYKNWISDIENLSVREDAGAKIIKDLTGRDVPVLIDPTFMLTKENWLSISNIASRKTNSHYLLTYFLGDITNEYNIKIKKIAKKNNLEIINLYDRNDKTTFETGPSEFIDYLNSASIFCTDSFHGVVFSILFEKSFFVFERVGKTASMYSRIETLLSKFNLESRKMENIELNPDDYSIDFSGVSKILEVERSIVIRFLKESLDLNNSDNT